MLNDANTNLLYLESKRRKKKKKEKKPRHREWLQNIVSTKGDVNRVKFARGQLRRDLTYQAFTPQPFLRANVLSACFFFFFFWKYQNLFKPYIHESNANVGTPTSRIARMHHFIVFVSRPFRSTMSAAAGRPNAPAKGQVTKPLIAEHRITTAFRRYKKQYCINKFIYELASARGD